MTANSNPPDDSADALRARALQRAHEEDKASKHAKSVRLFRQAALTPGIDIELAHELRVHQIELEMQNEELRESKLALEKSRARYFDLYELAPMGYLTVSEAGLILDCNLTAATMLGLPRGRLKTKAFGQLLAKQDQDAWYLLRRKLAAADEHINAELRVVRGDGSQLWCMIALANSTDELGVTATRVVISDLTERKAAEELLRSSDAALKAVSQGVIVTTPDLLIGSVNAAFTAITGYSEADALGRNCRFMQGPDTDPNTTAAIRTALVQRTEFDGEILNYRKDGTPFWNALTISPVLDGQGVLTHFVGITRDITARKRAEDALRESASRYRTLVEHSPYCIHEIDLEGRFTAMNHAGLKMMGVNDVCFIQEMPYLDVVGDRDRERITGLLANALAGQSSEFDFQTGNGMAVHSTFVPITDDKGVVQRLMGLSIDITERKLAEQAQKALLNDKVALLREVHHRVKNNLQVITSLLRLEASRSEMSETKSVLTLMQGRIHAMAQLHETLYRSGTFAEIDLAAYLGTLCKQIFAAHSVRRDFVKLEIDLASVQVNMDQATSCGLLLNELVSNCLKHAFPDDRPGEVSVTLQPLQTITQVNGALWRLRVQDTGVGLPGNFEERRKSSLGLQLVGDLSLQAGGDLVIESEPGKGTVFTVDFEALLPAALEMPS